MCGWETATNDPLGGTGCLPASADPSGRVALAACQPVRVQTGGWHWLLVSQCWSRRCLSVQDFGRQPVNSWQGLISRPPIIMIKPARLHRPHEQVDVFRHVDKRRQPEAKPNHCPVDAPAERGSPGVVGQQRQAAITRECQLAEAARDVVVLDALSLLDDLGHARNRTATGTG